MSWTGQNKDAIDKAETTFRLDPTTAKAVVCASVYYSGVGTQYQLWRQQPWRIDFFLLMWRWRTIALRYAVMVTTEFLMWGKFNENSLTADQVDVLATVLLRLGKRRFEGEVGNLLRYIDQNHYQEIAPHTQAFLTMHGWRVGYHERSTKTESDVANLALATARLADRDEDSSVKTALYGQASRVYRNLADFVPEKRGMYLTFARECAKKGGVTDQLLKLGLEPS